MFDSYFAIANRLQTSGEPFATAVVVRAEKPTSARPGDRAIVTADGVLHGWIGGSCAQPTVVRLALASLADHRSRLVRLSPEPDVELPPGFEGHPMTCFSGGTLDVYIEPQPPLPRLIVVGDLPVARCLAQLGQVLGYRVLAVTADGGAAVEHADETRHEIEAIAEWATVHSFVVVATHGNFDEPAVTAALRSPARYVALVASRKRAEAVREHLDRQGLGAESHRLRAPAGLDIGAVRGDEIALSILAEIVQLRRRELPTEESVTARTEEAAAPTVEAAEASCGCAGAEPLAARDPVCGMEVQVSGTTPTVALDGLAYYFCCGGCAARFESEPLQYLKG